MWNWSKRHGRLGGPLWWGYSRSRPGYWYDVPLDTYEFLWEDQWRHGANVFLVTADVEIGWYFNSAGELQMPFDFSRFDEIATRAQAQNGRLMLSFTFNRTGTSLGNYLYPSAGLDFLTPAWKSAFATILTEIRDHLLAMGYDYDDFVFYLFDEYIDQDMIDVHSFVRTVDPQLWLMANPYRGDLDPAVVLTPLADLVDVWVPQLVHVVAY